MNYKTSKDYDELFELVIHDHVIAAFIVDYDTDDICKVWVNYRGNIEVSAWGLTYFDDAGNTGSDEFKAFCKSKNLEFIPPDYDQ